MKWRTDICDQFSGDGDLERFVVENGCYSTRENLRIYSKFFAGRPSRSFSQMFEKYNLSSRTVCDAGCGYGINLLYFARESYGIDVSEYQVEFARSLDLVCIYQRDIVSDDLADLPKVDVIWCSAVLEHVDSPHVFLRKLASLLKDNGMLIIMVPIIPVFKSLRKLPWLGKYFVGYLASDHVNAFTPEALRFDCERAGFETVELSACFPHVFSVFNHLSLFRCLSGRCAYVGRKIRGWEYPVKSTRRVSGSPESATVATPG